MASIGHVAVGLALGRWGAGAGASPWRLAGAMAALSALALLPDADVPLSNERLFAPVRPLPEAPIGAGMLSARGLRVVTVELVAFFPLWLYALWPRRPR